MKNIGTKKIARIVADSMPPTTARPIAFCPPAPAPVAGERPNLFVVSSGGDVMPSSADLASPAGDGTVGDVALERWKRTREKLKQLLLDGQLEGVHADYFDEGSSTTQWRLDTGPQTLDVLPTTLPALSAEHDNVALTDEDPGAGVAGPVKAASAQTTPALGGRQVAVIAFKFASDPASPPLRRAGPSSSKTIIVSPSPWPSSGIGCTVIRTRLRPWVVLTAGASWTTVRRRAAASPSAWRRLADRPRRAMRVMTLA